MEKKLSYFQISWLSENDGPGKRLVLFLQGCPLSCAWCHSPHSKPGKSPLHFYEALCIRCRRCEQVCPNQVHQFNGPFHTINRQTCKQCGMCIESCPQSSVFSTGGALSLPTRSMDIDSLFELIRPQLEFIGNQGGITFSGGEPLNQVDPLTILAKKCKAAGIHTALETSGVVHPHSIKTILPFIDTWLIGMRMVTGPDSTIDRHLERHLTAILQQLSANPATRIIVRIPAIPGITDTSDYLSRVKNLIRKFQIQEIDILPHNRESEHYYQAIGLIPEIRYEEVRASRSHSWITQYLVST